MRQYALLEVFVWMSNILTQQHKLELSEPGTRSDPGRCSRCHGLMLAVEKMIRVDLKARKTKSVEVRA